MHTKHWLFLKALKQTKLYVLFLRFALWPKWGGFERSTEHHPQKTTECETKQAARKTVLHASFVRSKEHKPWSYFRRWLLQWLWIFWLKSVINICNISVCPQSYINFLPCRFNAGGPNFFKLAIDQSLTVHSQDFITSMHIVFYKDSWHIFI